MLFEYSVKPNVSKTGGSFIPIKVYSADGKSFLPSVGGISAVLNGKEKNPWDEDVNYRLISNSILENDTVLANWEMFSGKENYRYSFKMKIEERTLTLKINGDIRNTNEASGIKIDRCENAINPYTIEIPYLPMFSALLTNNEFLTFFADWELTNASELIPYYPSRFSETSVYYSHYINYNPKTNNQRNLLNETLYLTISPNIDDVFPSISNPVSEYKSVCSKQILWDYRQPFSRLIQKPWNYLNRISKAGIKNIWLQIHDWQSDHASTPTYLSGYDDGFPCVLPANTNYIKGNEYGGDEVLQNVISTARNKYKFRIGLHQNYVDIYKNADCQNFGYNQAVVALDKNGKPAEAWFNELTKVQSFLLRPSKTGEYTEYWSQKIQSEFDINGCYLDVHSSVNPSEKVDYDLKIKNAGKFKETLINYRNLYTILRKSHNGPVQGEGGFHFLYQGYIDNVEARIRTSGTWDTLYNIPLLVNFDLLKLKQKAFVHGVGFYPFFLGLKAKLPSKKYVLAYIATELAYGHGAYIPDSFATGINIIEHGKLEYKHVFSIQKDLVNAKVRKILYNDNGELITASDYIRRHADNFDNINSKEFMGQVCIEYNNGIKIYVNRNSHKSWEVNFGVAVGWFNYNANGKLYTGNSQIRIFKLPPVNGWVVFNPNK